ncbi:MAG: DUF58 domain-containing protein [Clostridia bacterium]|nr:DUF58 domain-containing protein [Clostridia bacterium]
MTRRFFYLLLLSVVTALGGFSSGNPVFLVVAVLSACTILISFLTVLTAVLTLRVDQSELTGEVLRQEKCLFQPTFRMFSILPLGPITIDILLPSGKTSTYVLNLRFFVPTVSSNVFPCPHVGLFPVGIQNIYIMDAFHLFHIRRHFGSSMATVRVKPLGASVSPIPVKGTAEEGVASAYASTDYTTPDGIRNWMQGDEMKRVHWKLSAKKQTLLVRTYETLERPDTLILLNSGGIDLEQPFARNIIDALTESCAGTISALLRQNRPICMPIPEFGTEFRGSSFTHYADVQRILPTLNFRKENKFPEVLETIGPRLQRSSYLLIFSAVITPQIVDAIIRMSMYGTSIRFTMATDREPDAGEMKLLQMLVSANVETFQVLIA